MKYIRQVDIGKKISKIGLGTGRFGTKIEEGLAFELLDCFSVNGGTVLDTARNYYEWVENGRGKSEECLGKWMEKRQTREDMCIVTKGGVRNEGNQWNIDLSGKALKEELKQSLEALRTEYIDIYLLHRDEKERPVEEIVETMQDVRERGKISFLGVANWSYVRVRKANDYAKEHGMEPFRMIQTWWSLAEYTQEMWNDVNTTHMDAKMYQYILENSYIGMAYTSQCKGYFQKAIREGKDGVTLSLRKRIETKTNLKKLEYIKEYCEEKQISPTAAMCGYITDNPATGIALVSTSRMEQLEDIMNWCDYKVGLEFIRQIDLITD